MNAKEANARQNETFGHFFVFLVIASFIAVLYPVSRTNYLLFHTLVELISIAFSFTLFSIGWNARKFIQNDSFVLLAIAFLVIGSFDLLHTLSYKGMGALTVGNPDLPTQYWIAARLVQSTSYLIAAFYVGKHRQFKPWLALACYMIIGFSLKLTIWPLQIFPHCFIENVGLTNFKIAAEYFTCLTFGVSGILFWIKKQHFNPVVLKLVLFSIALTVLSEVTFTLYQDVYGFSNVLGHLFKLAAIVILYRSFVYGALKTPYQTLFHELSESYVAIDKELEQRRIKEEELRDTNKELEAFSRTVSHDLRKPLTVITSGAELLQSELGPRIDNSHKQLLSLIENQGHHMSTLMDDLLSLAKAGMPDQQKENIKPSLIADQVLHDLSKEIMDKRCRVEIGEMPELQAHRSMIYQLLLNLISNAISHGANQDKPIEVGAELGINIYRLYVRDYGAGVPSEDRENIFEVFYQSDKNKSPGTGIGLAIVQKIAHFYSGRAFIEDTPGGGATFWVELLIE